MKSINAKDKKPDMMPSPDLHETQASNLFIDYKNVFLNILHENRDAMVHAYRTNMDAIEIFETDNIYEAVIETYNDLIGIINGLDLTNNSPKQ